MQVCPVGIDIREGLQYQCIACAMCVDACDSIMDKLAYPRGLIRYTTENSLNGIPTHFFRPRTLGYGAVVVFMVSFFIWRLLSIEPIEIGVLHDREHMSSVTAAGQIENRYTLKIANKTADSQQYKITVLPENFQVVGQTTPYVLAGEVTSIRLRILKNVRDDTGEQAEKPNGKISDIEFVVTDENGKVFSHFNRFIELL